MGDAPFSQLPKTQGLGGPGQAGQVTFQQHPVAMFRGDGLEHPQAELQAVVQDQRRAHARASNTARAFCRVSSYSNSRSDSAVMPPPTPR